MNRVLKQFVEMRKMLKTIGADGGRREGQAPRARDGEVVQVAEAGGYMFAIRLRRTGSKKRPFFRVVVTD